MGKTVQGTCSVDLPPRNCTLRRRRRKASSRLIAGKMHAAVERVDKTDILCCETAVMCGSGVDLVSF